MDFSIILYCLKIIVTYIVPLVALLLSIISLYKSVKGQNLQDRVNELELKIKQYEVAELDKKKTQAELACVEARVIKISSGNYRLKVWNSGQATAYKVTASIDKDANLTITDSKMPFDFLDAGKNFEELLFVQFGTANKFKITIEWEDASGKAYRKEQMGSL